MKIAEVIFSVGFGGWYCDDKEAISAGVRPEGHTYRGQPKTPGFKAIREPGECLSIMLVLEDGSIACGDCVSVTYAGFRGRDPVFRAAESIRVETSPMRELLVGREVTNFRQLAEEVAHLPFDEPHLATAFRYGLSQALLSARAKTVRRTMAEVVCAEYGLPLPSKPVRLVVQTGDDRYNGADKAIMKRADVLPHALINDVPSKLGIHGEKLLEYAQWLKERIELLGGSGYEPVIHFDVYGTIGRAFDHDLDAIVEYIMKLEATVQPHPLQVESPVEMEVQDTQIELMAALCSRLEQRHSQAKIVADEWCNTLEDVRRFVEARACHLVQVKMPDLGGIQNSIEAVLYCKRHSLDAYLGGSCNETDVSARVAAHIALATDSDQVLARPGMGVDEALMVMYNEMGRVLAICSMRRGDGSKRPDAAAAE